MSLGAVYLATSLIFLYICVTCVNDMERGSLEHQFFWLFTAELFVLGAVSSWPSFRQRAHAALLARDGQISSAASVAASAAALAPASTPLVSRKLALQEFGIAAAGVLGAATPAAWLLYTSPSPRDS